MVISLQAPELPEPARRPGQKVDRAVDEHVGFYAIQYPNTLVTTGSDASIADTDRATVVGHARSLFAHGGQRAKERSGVPQSKVMSIRSLAISPVDVDHDLRARRRSIRVRTV